MLAIGQNHNRVPALAEHLLQRLQIKWCNRLIGNHQYVPALNVRVEQARLVEQATADEYWVTALFKVYGDGNHESVLCCG